MIFYEYYKILLILVCLIVLIETNPKLSDVKEKLMSKISSILSKIKRFENKVIILKSSTADGEVIIHIVSNIKQNSTANLGEIMFECNNQTGGIGIGSKFTGKAKIPLSKSEEFIKLINAKL